MEQISETILTVAVITYNHGHTLKKCISSIARQTYNKIDLVIVDDYSCDFDREEIEAYIHDLGSSSLCGVSVDAFSEHKGLAAAYNRALQLAKGAYILFIAGDDLLAQDDVLAQFMDELGDNSLADVFQGQAVFLQSRDQLPSACCRNYAQAGNALSLLKETKYQPFSQLLCIQSAFFRTEWIRDIGGFPNDYQFAIDWPVYIKALYHNAVFSFSNLVVTKMGSGGAFRSYDIGTLYLRKGYLREAGRAIREYAIEEQRGLLPEEELLQLECIANVYESKPVSDFDWYSYSLPDRIAWKRKNKTRIKTNKKQYSQQRLRAKTLLQRFVFGVAACFMLSCLIIKLTEGMDNPFPKGIIPCCIAVCVLEFLRLPQKLNIRWILRVGIKRFLFDIIAVFFLFSLLSKPAGNIDSLLLHCVLPLCMAICILACLQRPKTDSEECGYYSKILCSFISILILLIILRIGLAQPVAKCLLGLFVVILFIVSN